MVDFFWNVGAPESEIDRLNELDEFGRHKGKSSSLLDQLWPMIESHDMFFVSETTPGGLQAMLEQAELGIKLALKGKMSPFPDKIKNPKQFSEALAKAKK